MEKWYNKHAGIIFFIGVTASVITYAYTNFSTKAELSEFKTDIKDDIKEIKQDVKILLQRGDK